MSFNPTKKSEVHQHQSHQWVPKVRRAQDGEANNFGSSASSEQRERPSSSSRAKGRGVKGKGVQIPAEELFNFQRYEPRHSRGGGPFRRRRNVTQTEAFVKERFVKANFRCWVSRGSTNTAEVRRALWDPDVNLDWGAVSGVELLCPEGISIQCPICLEENDDIVCPKVTMCGHVFCWPCILRYLNTDPTEAPYFPSIANDPNAPVTVVAERSAPDGRTPSPPALPDHSASAPQGKRYWRRCPLCSESVVKRDLRPIAFQRVRNFPALVEDMYESEEYEDEQVDTGVDFCLVQREEGSTSVTLPRYVLRCVPTHMWEACRVRLNGEEDRFAVNDKVILMDTHIGVQFSRVGCLSDPFKTSQQELRILTSHRKECESSGDTDIIPAVDEALAYLNRTLSEMMSSIPPLTATTSDEERISIKRDEGNFIVYNEQILLSIIESSLQGGPQTEGSPPQAEETIDSAAVCVKDAWDSDNEMDDSDAAAANKQPTAISPPTNATNKPTSMGTTEEPESTATTTTKANGYLFYQTADGQNAFLEPFLTRCLLYEHGDWAHLPPLLRQLTLIGSNEITLNESMRKRYKFLSHLPLSSSIRFLDVDITPLLSDKTRTHFRDEFVKRERARRAADNKRRQEKRLAEQQQQQYTATAYVNDVHATVQMLPLSSIDESPSRCVSERHEDAAQDAPAEEEEEEVTPTLADKIKAKMQTDKDKQKQEESREHFPSLLSASPPANETASASPSRDKPSTTAWGTPSLKWDKKSTPKSTPKTDGKKDKDQHRDVPPIDIEESYAPPATSNFDISDIVARKLREYNEERQKESPKHYSQKAEKSSGIAMLDKALEQQQASASGSQEVGGQEGHEADGSKKKKKQKKIALFSTSGMRGVKY
ncbi:unnamed protein product [Vitrella brassicaformis CCMP3155]|uniref:RING-type domain-containing protein n=2 Tax=Vitrella brassicaformis TaxID=1169539 RepID=A0A0G4GUF7_VITBC|nr:unnamed protein product [Vitrella brassicaformis CCMP3155]|eukprot:CEM34195.1 unnamed protein product [Vitrella brassicaformis CCMP3155]